ncbi:MAG: sulfotransferase domain-containing protein [Parvibaculaceae bacterium]|nr:sulfotransferase domain-containing protein [Parvibaculaceae bacterium]
MGALIWLASYPKSGNTWMRIFLLNLLRDRDEPLDINRMGAMSPTDSSRGWYEPFARAPLEELTMAELAKLRPQGHRRISELRPDPILVKTHNFFGSWKGVPLHTASLTSGAIYIVRNPLDVVLSTQHHFGVPDIEGAIGFIANEGAGTKLTGEQVPEFYRSWSGHVRSWTERPSPKILVVRYEDLVSAPEKEFGRVVRFLGIPADAAKIARAIRFASFDQLKKQESERGFIEKPDKAERFFREGKSGGWQDRLSPDQVARIVADHREQMARFNYIPDGY